MELCVLLSCMYEKDVSIIKRSNIQTNVVIVNQCNIENTEEYDFINKKGNQCYVKLINTKERGLSKSRNMAIRNSEHADICILCDDDECYEDNYESEIKSAFAKHEDTDIIIWAIKNSQKCKDYEYDIGLLQSGSVCSVQIAFRREKILKAGIEFDVLMGSGSGNGDGEEVKFIVDCLKAGLKIKYIPKAILTINKESESIWFKGYTKEYFVNKGWSLRRIFGTILSYILIWRFLFRKFKLYKSDIDFITACISMHNGYFMKK